MALVRAKTYLITFQQTAFAAYDIGQEGQQLLSLRLPHKFKLLLAVV